MEKWNTPIQISSRKWSESFLYLNSGDLVWVGPVHKQVPGILIERKKPSFSYDPDEWDVLIDGKIESYPTYLITNWPPERLLNDNYCYNLQSYYGDIPNDKKWR